MPAYITVLGRLGRDPESRHTSGGNVCTISVASDSGYGDRKKTTWFTCSIWGRSGESAMAHLRKGANVLVNGQVAEEQYTATDGTTRKSLRVDVNDWRFAGERPRDDGGSSTDMPF